jgi:DNA repair protein RecO (recombination protein O)
LKEEIHGVILKTIPFGDYDQILTIFTEQDGIKNLIVKGALRKSGQSKLTSPLTLAQFIIAKGRSDLAKCTEISPLNRHLHLRDRLESLMAAGSLIKAVLSTQQHNKPAPLLFQLLTHYLSHLDKMETSSYPEALASSFQLKILHHDGMMHISPLCSLCNIPIKQFYIAEGQCFCPQHSPSTAFTFSEEESDLLLLLTYSRSMKEMSSMAISQHFQEKITQLFSALIDNIN